MEILQRIYTKLGKLLGRRQQNNWVDQLYDDHTYLEAYSKHTDLRVKHDPKGAVGGMWEELGALQMEFLIANGLRPKHKLLDVGCGTLRGGRHFIRYLDADNYFGFDISPEAITSAMNLVEIEGLSKKRPTITMSKNKELNFLEYLDVEFDYLIAQSVFTHLKAEHIEVCFQSLSKVMNQNSKFYFTYKQGKDSRQVSHKDFCYPPAFFEELAREYGDQLRDCSQDYHHPRGQKMIELMRGSDEKDSHLR